MEGCGDGLFDGEALISLEQQRDIPAVCSCCGISRVQGQRVCMDSVSCLWRMGLFRSEIPAGCGHILLYLEDNGISAKHGPEEEADSGAGAADAAGNGGQEVDLPAVRWHSGQEQPVLYSGKGLRSEPAREEQYGAPEPGPERKGETGRRREDGIPVLK